MGEAIGQVLAYGVGVALSPIPIIAVVLMLATPRGRVNGPAFLGGWILALAVVGAIVLLAAGSAGASDQGRPATWVSIAKIVVGLLLLLVAAGQWRHRPRPGGERAALPQWMRSIDRFTPGRSAGVAAALAAVNPKNLPLTAGAAAAIAQTGVGAGRQAIALAVFILVATLGPGIPVAIYFAMGDRATRLLEELRDWMAANNAAIMAALCLVIGAKLVGDGITGLS